MRLLRRPGREPAPIQEDEAYARCHGERSGDLVRVVKLDRPTVPRRTGDLTGELLRRAFEARLDARSPAETTSEEEPSGSHTANPKSHTANPNELPREEAR